MKTSVLILVVCALGLLFIFLPLGAWAMSTSALLSAMMYIPVGRAAIKDLGRLKGMGVMLGGFAYAAFGVGISCYCYQMIMAAWPNSHPIMFLLTLIATFGIIGYIGMIISSRFSSQRKQPQKQLGTSYKQSLPVQVPATC